MLIGLGIRDVVLIETLDLSFGPGLTALTCETGAGKSIILDALWLAAGTHRPARAAFGGPGPGLAGCAEAWSAWRAAREKAQALREDQARAAAETEEVSLRLQELERLDPRLGEETELAEERALLASAEKALADIAAAREHLGGDTLISRLAQAFRALERARERALQAGANAEGATVRRLTEAGGAGDRALIEATEASAAGDAAGAVFDFQPHRLGKAGERRVALRALARQAGPARRGRPAARA